MHCRLKRNISLPAQGVVITLIVLVSVLLQFCSREDMYSYATDKHPVVYALTDTDDLISTMIIKANGEGYYNEIVTTIPSGTATLMDVDKDGNIYLFDGATGTYIVDENDSSTYVLSPLSTVTGAASNDRGTFIFSSSSMDVYRYDDGTSSWTFYKTLSTAYFPVNISMDIDDGIIYYMASSGGQVYIYHMESEVMPIPTYNIGPGGYWFEVNNGSFYNGKTTATNLTLNGTYMGGLVSPVATTYASVDDGSVFAAVNDGNLAIYKFNGTTFVSVYRFSSAAGVMSLAGMREGELAVGLCSTDMFEDGLYVFYYEKGKMKKLSSKAVYMMYVR